MEYLLVWQIRPTHLDSQYLIITPSNKVDRYSTTSELTKSLLRRKAPVAYTNMTVLHNYIQKDGLDIRTLTLSSLEYRYLFDLQSRWHPDHEDASELLDRIDGAKTQKRIMPLIKWLANVHHYVEAIDSYQLIKPSQAAKPSGNFSGPAQWLGRPFVRLYPEGVLMDRLVYGARWQPSHYKAILELGAIVKSPTRNPRLLKSLRHEPQRIFSHDGEAFLLVKWQKLARLPVDTLPAHANWMTVSELRAYQFADPALKFEIEDCLSFSLEPLVDIQGKREGEDIHLFEDQTLELSVTYGNALRQIVHRWSDTWTMCYWRSVERGQWLTLYHELRRKHDIVLSGYGGGYLSFHCWHGEMAKICQELMLRGSVLKQSDEEFDLEYRNAMLERYQIEALQGAEKQDEQTVNDDIPASQSPF